ncbi:hypothetical protein FOHLNKBM_5816 [Methylobacterium longum]|uniref:hypothetical protein n=1 Tax=Methylobacterium longum TaxID=767694 RepID=UPI001EE27CAE|nr:hypothetical protein [Methylobacterium longum]GJE14741.1 hypothetical protein FOHLNKBM_5816 [Methylobacterium longum]
MDTVQATMLGCGLMLAGWATANFDAHRWHLAGQRTPIDTLTVLSFALPFAGLVMIAATAA